MKSKKVMLANKWDKSQKVDFAQPKLDGIRCKGYRGEMRTRNEKLIISQPHIMQEIDILHNIIGFTGIQFIDGELYNHELNDDFEKIKGLVTRSKNIDTKQSERYIQYHVYDMCADYTFAERYHILLVALNRYNFKYLKLVETSRIFNDEDELHQRNLSDGYEGTIYRKDTLYTEGRTSNLLKRKEFQDSEYKIIDIIEGEGKLQGVAGKIVFEGFKASIAMNYETKEYLLDNKHLFIGKLATVQYFSIKNGIPRFPVFKSVRNYE